MCKVGVVVAAVVLAAGCRTAASVPADLSPVTYDLILECTGPLAEFCGFKECRTYDEQLAQWRALVGTQECPTKKIARCGDVLLLIDQRISGTGRYYDSDGQLIGAVVGSDQNNFCDRQSFSQLFGQYVYCPDPEIIEVIC